MRTISKRGDLKKSLYSILLLLFCHFHCFFGLKPIRRDYMCQIFNEFGCATAVLLSNGLCIFNNMTSLHFNGHQQCALWYAIVHKSHSISHSHRCCVLCWKVFLISGELKLGTYPFCHKARSEIWCQFIYYGSVSFTNNIHQLFYRYRQWEHKTKHSAWNFVDSPIFKVALWRNNRECARTVISQSTIIWNQPSIKGLRITSAR